MRCFRLLNEAQLTLNIVILNIEYHTRLMTSCFPFTRGHIMQQPDTNNDTMNLEQLVRLGIQTARAGNRASARLMFERVLAVNNNEERAWFWLASLADNDDDKRRYLQTVLKLNPGNEIAKRA